MNVRHRKLRSPPFTSVYVIASSVYVIACQQPERTSSQAQIIHAVIYNDVTKARSTSVRAQVFAERINAWKNESVETGWAESAPLLAGDAEQIK